MTKYRSKHVFYDVSSSSVVSKESVDKYRKKGRLQLPSYICRFDSVHEFSVYLELVRLFGADRIIRQYEVELLPTSLCYPKGKTWRCDFAVLGESCKDAYRFLVEAKGAFLPEFAYVLSTLEQQNKKAFDKLRVIFNAKPSKKNRVVKALLDTDYRKNLITFKELERLTELT